MKDLMLPNITENNSRHLSDEDRAIWDGIVSRAGIAAVQFRAHAQADEQRVMIAAIDARQRKLRIGRYA